LFTRIVGKHGHKLFLLDEFDRLTEYVED